MDVKWIKLMTDMFDNRKIRYLRRLPEGNSIVLIWVMLLSLAGRCNAGGMIHLTQDIPYTPKMLADELDFEENTVVLALKALENLGMISRDPLEIRNWEEYQSTDKLEKIREQNRLRKQKQRALETASRDSNVTVTQDVTQCHATDIDIEEEKEKELDSSSKNKTARGAEFERFWSVYPKKVGKKDAERAFERAMRGSGGAHCAQLQVDDLIAAVERQKCSEQWTKENGRYIPNPATWLNQGRWEDELPAAKGNGYQKHDESLSPAMQAAVSRMLEEMEEGEDD